MSAYVIPPVGTSALSFWTPTPFVDPARPPAILCRKRNPLNGAIVSLFEGVHPVDGMVIEQFRIRRASGAAVLDEGQAFAAITKMEDTTADALRHECERIVAPLVAAGFIEVLGLVVEANPDHDVAGVFLSYRNLHTSKDQAVRIPQ